MVLVVLYIKAELAYHDILAAHALILCLIYQLSLAADAFEPSIVIWLFGFFLERLVLLVDGASSNLRCGLSVCLHSGLLLLSPPLTVLIEDVKALRTPVCSAEWALQGLAIGKVVLEASFQAIRMNLPTTAVQTMRKIFVGSKSVTANATSLIVFERSGWNLCTLCLLLLTTTNPDPCVTDRGEASICVGTNAVGI